MTKTHMTKNEAEVENQRPRTQVTSNNLQIQDAVQRFVKILLGAILLIYNHKGLFSLVKIMASLSLESMTSW